MRDVTKGGGPYVIFNCLSARGAASGAGARTCGRAVLGLALAYGGVAQVLAGMWEFRTGNTFGAVAFTSFGAFWISYWALVTFFSAKIPAADAGHAVGLYLWAGAIFTTYMFVASLRTTAAVALVFALLSVTFVLLGIGNSGGHETVIHW